jgi:hypothetical protein
MAIALFQDDYLAHIHDGTTEEPVIFTAEQFDFTWSYPPQWGQGYVRDIWLREGLEISIADYSLHHDLILTSADREHPLELTYILIGNECSEHTSVHAGQHNFLRQRHGSWRSSPQVRQSTNC